MSEKIKKLIVIGLDGASWTILHPLIEKGYMPTLRNMVNNGVSSILESTVPPVTGPSWISFATGKNPAKTGIFDFLTRDPHSYRLKPARSTQFRGHAFWDYLSSLGYRVGIVSFPLLYPPYEIHGFMLSGVGAPIGSNVCFPQELQKEIEELIGDYEIYVNYHDPKYDDEELFLRDLSAFITKHKRMVKYLLENKDWDLFIYVFSATDWMQHLFWKHLDDHHPLYDPNRSPSLRKKFVEFFHEIDSFLEEILDVVKYKANILLLSDHGFGTQDQCFNLFRWLREKGYLRISNLKRMKANIKKCTLKLLTLVNRLLKVKSLFSTKVINTVAEILSPEIADIINFTKSRAYCLGHTIPFGAIYINLKGRDPQGIVDPEDYDELKAEIINELSKLSTEVGEPLDVKVYDLKKIYNLPKNALAPDIIFTINDWRCVIIEDDPDRPLFEKRPFTNRHTGAHRLEGIFIAFGPEFEQRKKIEKVRIIDIAPTILHMFNAPIPKDVDGRVLTEIFKPESESAKRKPRYVDMNFYKRKIFEERTKAKIKRFKIRKNW